jgi:hypothetical protein
MNWLKVAKAWIENLHYEQKVENDLLFNQEADYLSGSDEELEGV